MEQRIYKPGERLGHYEVVEQLATGGFSAVYRAKDLSDAQWAGHSAIKVCLYEAATMPLALIAEYNRRIEREFRLVANLDHANVVKVLEHLNHRGLGLYAMELLEGPTLGRFLAEERRPLAVLMDIFEQLVEAVAFCHREGVVHRDIKPSNVLVTPRKKQKGQEGEDVSEVVPVLYERRGVLRTRWQPVLLDFGVSHALAEPPITAGGRVTGTYEYLSPEYARAILGQRLDPAWQGGPGDDVYALAVLLYEMLTGRLPTRTPAENLVELLTEIRDATPAHPGELNPEAPPALSELAMEGLRKRRGERPADGLELLHRLGEAIAKDGERLRALAPEYRAAAETTAVGEPGAPEVARPVVSLAVRSEVRAEASAGHPREEESGGGASSVGRGDAGEGQEAAARPPSPRLGQADDEDRRIAQNIGVAGRLMESAQQLMRRARWMGVGAGVALLASMGLLLHSGHLARELASRVEHLAQVEEHLANASSPFVPAVTPPFGLDLTNVEPPTPLLMAGGLRMPDSPLPGQLRPPCIWEGRQLHAAELRGGCWYSGVNVYWAMDPPQKDKKCPKDWYDPPPEVPEYDKGSCYKPIIPDEKGTPKGPRSETHARPQDVP